MALIELPDLEQGSDEWLQQRCGIVTASVVGQLITAKTLKPADNPTSRGLTMSLIAERITGHVEPTYVSDDMYRGQVEEPIARDLYAEHYAPVTETGFMIRRELGWQLGYSPDGLVGDDGLIEIKSRRQKKHLTTILSGEVPAENLAQIHAGLLVTGRAWCDYISYCGGMPLWVRRVRPIQAWRDAITEAVRRFEQTAEQITDDYLTRVRGLPLTERIDHEEVELKL